jgi:O-acetyl-ADP-ribose deacetylase (regulator of RNase III)
VARPRIVIRQGDITDETTDAVVNAANTELILGAGVAGAIRRKGGGAVQAECSKIGPIPLGEAAVTTGGNLSARYVIHAASMGLGGPLTTESSLRDSVHNSLMRAVEKGLKSVAFPAIGTGVAGFPAEQCARIMLGEIDRFLRQEASPLEEVHIVLYDRPTLEVFQREFERMSDTR